MSVERVTWRNKTRILALTSYSIVRLLVAKKFCIAYQADGGTTHAQRLNTESLLLESADLS